MLDTIGIIGFGFVGKAIHHGFAQWADFRIYDKNPTLSLHTFEEVAHESDFIFICLPTPTDFETGSIDLSIIDDAIDRLGAICDGEGPDPIVVIKSTVVPGTIERYRRKHPQMCLVFNPEFLTERTSKLDFINQSRIILGGSQVGMNELEELYKVRFPGTPIFKTTSTAAELVKYMANCFFAVKVSFMNEMNQVCKKLGLEYKEVIAMVLADGRIGNSHWQVPGHDGHFGWGGKCVVGEEIAIVRNCEGDILLRSFEEMYDDSANYKMLSMSLDTEKVEFQPIEGIKCREVSQTLEVQTEKGYRVEVTPDHKMIIYKDGKWSKKEAKEIEIGDRLYIAGYAFSDQEVETIDLLDEYEEAQMVMLVDAPSKEIILQAYQNGNLTRDQYYRLKNGKQRLIPADFYLIYREHLPEVSHIQSGTRDTGRYPRYIQMDNDWAKLIGYYAAEGSITGGRTYFSFNHIESEYIQEVKEILARKGLNWCERVQQWKGKDSCCVIWVNHSVLAYILKEIWGCGENCYVKRLPSIVQSNRTFARQALEGFIRGDGSINGAGRQSKYVTINISTSSRILSEQLGCILRSYGILPSYTRKKNAKSDNLSYQWDISRKKDIETLLDCVNLLPQEESQVREKLSHIKHIRAQKFDAHSQGWLVKVCSVTSKNQKVKVYSTQVQENENFITSGGLLVSNCFPKDLNAMIHKMEELGVTPTMLQAAWEKNLEVRQEQDWFSIEGAAAKE